MNFGVEGSRKHSAWGETRDDVGGGTGVFLLDKCGNSAKKQKQELGLRGAYWQTPKHPLS